MTSEVQKIIDNILLKAREEAEAIIVETRESTDRMVENQKKLAFQKAEGETSKILKKGQRNKGQARRHKLCFVAGRPDLILILKRKIQGKGRSGFGAARWRGHKRRGDGTR